MNVELNDRVSSFMDWKRARIPKGMSEFDPSGCESSAGLVLNRIVALGWMVTVYTGPYKNQGVKCRCCIMRGPQDFVLGGVDVVAETRSLAICRAFVEAMERWGNE